MYVCMYVYKYMIFSFSHAIFSFFTIFQRNLSIVHTFIWNQLSNVTYFISTVP